MATLEEIKQQEITPENKTLGAPDGLKGLSYGQRQQLRKQQQMMPKKKVTIGGDNETVIRPDIGYNPAFDVASKFDAALGDYYGHLYEGQDLGDMRSNLQTRAGKLLNSVINNVAIAGSTAIFGTLGLVDGLIETIATGENKMGDNVMSNAQNDFLKWMEENVPTYRGQQYENKSLFQKLGTVTFWGDFIKNLGYTEGMLIPGMGASNVASKISRMFNAGAKTTEWVSRLTGSLVGAMTEAATEATSNAVDQKQYKLNLLQDKYDAEMKAATGNQEEMYKLYKEKEKALEDIETDKTKSANFIFWANTGLLMATNLIEFGSLFGKSYDSGRRVLTNSVKTKLGEKPIKNLRDITKENIKDLKAVGLSKAKEITRVTGKKIADSVSEGFEEFSQGVIAHRPEIGKDYNLFNESILNPEKKEMVDGYMNSWFKSLTDYLDDPNAGVETLMGFLTGFLGAPTYVRGRGITWGNGVITEIHNAAREGRISNQVATQLNDMIEHISTNEKFLARYKGLIRNLELEDAKNLALEQGDKVAYKNAESAQFISDVETFRKAGQVDMFKKVFETMSDMSDEDVASIIATTTDETGNGPFSKNGKSDSIEDVRNAIKAKSDKYLRNIDRIVDDAEKLEMDLRLHADRLSDDEFNTLLYLKEQGYNFNERLVEMVTSVAGRIKGGSYDQIMEGAKALVENYDTTIEKNSKKNETLKEDAKEGIEDGSYKRFDISNVLEVLKGSKKKEALSREEAQLVDDIIEGKYREYISYQKNDDGTITYSVLHPDDWEALTNTISKNKANYAKLIETTIDHFKNSSINQLVASLEENYVAFNWISAILNEKALNDETITTLNDVKQMFSDIERVASQADYYNKEFTSLYKQYTEETKKRGFGSGVKEKAYQAVEKVKTKVKANKIRKQKAAEGQDTSNKTDEEVVKEDELQKDNADASKSEYETIKNKIIDSLEGSSKEEKDALGQYIDAMVAPMLVGIDDASEEEKKNRYQQAIQMILDHDNYDDIPVESEDGQKLINKIKDAVREISSTRKNFEKQEQPEPKTEEKKSLFESVPLDTEKQEEKESTSIEEQEPSKATPLDYLTNAIPETPREVLEAGLSNTPLWALSEEQRKKAGSFAKNKDKWNSYVQNVLFLNSVGAYAAVSQLLSPMFKSKSKVPVKFMMLNTDAGTFEKDGKKLHKIYHVVDVTDNEEWIKAHGTQLFEYKGRKYQVVGIQAENVATSNLDVLNSKLRKDSEGKFENNIYVSDSETFVTTMIRGKQNTGVRTIGTQASNISNVLKDNDMNLKDFVFGLVLGEEGSKYLAYVNKEGKVAKASLGDSDVKFGPFMILPSADPNVSRYVRLVIPYLNDYLKNNPNSQFTEKIVEVFTSLAEEAIKHIGDMDEDTVKSLFGTIHNLIYFGKEEEKGNISVKSFDKGDKVDIVMGLKPDTGEYVNTHFVFDKNASKEDIAKEMKAFLFGRFSEIISSDSFMKEGIDGKKYPLFRISLVAPKEYNNRNTSIGNAVTALGLKGNPNVVYKEFVVNNNLLQTDIGTTREVNAGYALAKYDPQSNSFVKGDDTVRKQQPTVVKPEPVIQQGTETTQKTTQISIAVPINLLSSNKVGSRTAVVSLVDGKLTIVDKKGKNMLPMFPKSYRDAVKEAMETKGELPATPEFYIITVDNKVYIAYLDEEGNLDVMDSNYDFIKDKEEKEKIREAFREKLNPKKEESSETEIGPTTSLVSSIAGAEAETPTQEEHTYTEEEKKVLYNNVQTLVTKYKMGRQAGGSKEVVMANLLQEVIEAEATPKEFAFIKKKLTEIIDSIERGKAYSGEKGNINIAKEVAWISKALPQLDGKTHIVKGFVRMFSDPTGKYMGKYMDGAIYLSENYATKGTGYHEAFHFVFNALFNDSEQKNVLQAAKRILGQVTDLDAEEWLADRFADFVAKKENNKFWSSPIGKFLSKVFNRIKSVLGFVSSNKAKLNDAFNRIYNGEFADRSIKEVKAERGKIFNLNAEEEKIKDKALTNGTFMKAPNGKPTNLTEKQWLQVRTKAFKNWFGDWENDPKNASKVVDENGEPLVIYHNSRKNFSEFKQQPYPAKESFSFSVNPNTASTYGEVSYPVFLNIRNLAVLNARGKSWKTFGYTLGIEKAKKGGYYDENMPKNYYGYEEPSDFVKYTLGEKYTGFVINNYKDNYSPEFEDVPGTIYGVFNPNQIKSATDNSGAFSTEDNNIYDTPAERMKAYTKETIKQIVKDNINFEGMGYIERANKIIAYYKQIEGEESAEDLRNKKIREIKNKLKNYPIKVTVLTPQVTKDAINRKNGILKTQQSISKAEYYGLKIERDEELIEEMGILEQIEREEFLKKENYDYARHQQNVDLAYDKLGGAISREVLETYSDEALESIIYCN